MIGGAYMFEQFSHLCDYFYVTEIQGRRKYRFEGDVYFRRELLEKYFETASGRLPIPINKQAISLFLKLTERKGACMRYENLTFEEMVENPRSAIAPIRPYRGFNKFNSPDYGAASNFTLWELMLAQLQLER